jgi:hypothetical protein
VLLPPLPLVAAERRSSWWLPDIAGRLAFVLFEPSQFSPFRTRWACSSTPDGEGSSRLWNHCGYGTPVQPRAVWRVNPAQGSVRGRAASMRGRCHASEGCVAAGLSRPQAWPANWTQGQSRLCRCESSVYCAMQDHSIRIRQTRMSGLPPDHALISSSPALPAICSSLCNDAAFTCQCCSNALPPALVPPPSSPSPSPPRS